MATTLNSVKSTVLDGGIMSKVVKAIGIILAFTGIVLIGFFDMGNQWLGPIGFPFSYEITNILGFLGFTVTWWNTKLWGLALGVFGALLMKYG